MRLTVAVAMDEEGWVEARAVGAVDVCCGGESGLSTLDRLKGCM